MFLFVVCMALRGTSVGEALDPSPSMTAYNCDEPLSIAVFGANERCGGAREEGQGQVTPGFLLQHTRIRRFRGFRCSVTRSRVTFYCGLWSYARPIPQHTGSIPLEVTAAECSTICRIKKYRPSNSFKKGTYDITVPGVTVFDRSELGWSGTMAGAVKCQGATTILEGKPVEGIVEIDSYVVTIRSEQFEEEEGKVLALSTRETLPCRADQKSCRGLEHAFFWRLNLGACPFQLLERKLYTRQVRGEGGKRLLLDSVGMLLLEIGNLEAVPGSCQDLSVHLTQLPGIYYSRHRPMAVQSLKAADLDPAVFMIAESQYLADALATTANHTAGVGERARCNREGAQEQNRRPVALGAGRFGLRRGDAWIEFHCKTETVQLISKASCYTDIPVHGQGERFIDPVSKIIKYESRKVACLEAFPIRLETSAGWVKITPKITAEPPPRHQGSTDGVRHHADSGTGLYTPSELEDWSHLLSFPDLAASMMGTITEGTCALTENCPLRRREDQPKLNLMNLVEEVGESAMEELVGPMVYQVGAIILEGLLWMSRIGGFIAFIRIAEMVARKTWSWARPRIAARPDDRVDRTELELEQL